MIYRKVEQRTDLRITKMMLAHSLSLSWPSLLHSYTHTKETLEVVNSLCPFGINERFSFK